METSTGLCGGEACCGLRIRKAAISHWLLSCIGHALEICQMCQCKCGLECNGRKDKTKWSNEGRGMITIQKPESMKLLLREQVLETCRRYCSLCHSYELAFVFRWSCLLS